MIILLDLNNLTDLGSKDIQWTIEVGHHHLTITPHTKGDRPHKTGGILETMNGTHRVHPRKDGTVLPHPIIGKMIACTRTNNGPMK